MAGDEDTHTTMRALPMPPRSKLVPAHLAPADHRRPDALVWMRRTYPGALWSVAVDDPVGGLISLGSGSCADAAEASKQVNTTLRCLRDFPGAVVHIAGSGGAHGARGAISQANPLLSLPQGTRIRDPYEAGDYRSELSEFAERSCVGMITAAGARVATDGSVSHFTKHAGYGWITDHGQFGIGVLGEQHDVLHAELSAVDDAMSHVSDGVHGTLYIDSQEAISMIERRLSQRFRPGLTKAQSARLNSIDRSPIRHMRIVKVKGHSGDLLNEAADRLAVLSRRASEHDIDLRATWQTASRIRDEVMAEIHRSQMRAAS